MQGTRDRGGATVYRAAVPPLAPPSGSVLDRVRDARPASRGLLRRQPPYAFTNDAGDLVGFDVDMALQLAQDLGVQLELVPMDNQVLLQGVDPAACDLVMSGIPVTANRAMNVLFTTPYLDETLALVVLDHRRGEFATWDGIRSRGGLRVGVPGPPYYLAKVRAELPAADVVMVDTAAGLFEPRSPALDALLLTAERGSAYTLLHPEYSVVIPKPRPVKVPLGYAVAGRDQALADRGGYVDRLEAQRRHDR